MTDGETGPQADRTPSGRTPSGWTPPRSVVIGAGTIVALVVAIVIVFFPGIFTPDVLDMCHQASSGRYTDAHSPVMVGMWGFLHPPVWTLFVVSVAVIVGASFVILRERLAMWTAVLATVLIALAPPVLSFLSVQGKDAWFVAAMLTLIACLSVASRAELPRGAVVALWVTSFVAVWSAIGARRNAVFAVVAVLVLGTPLASRSFDPKLAPRRRIRSFLAGVAAALAVVVLVLSAQSLLTDAVIRPRHRDLDQYFMRLDLSQMAQLGGDAVMPRELVRMGIGPDDSGPLFDGPESGFAMDPEREIRGDVAMSTLRSAWRRTLLEHPDLYLRFRLRYGAILLGLRGTPRAMVETPVLPRDLPPELGITCPVPRAIVPGLGPRIERALGVVQRSPLGLPWVHLVVLLGAAVVVGFGSVAGRCLLAFALVNQVSIIFLSIDPIGRYSWPLWVCTLLMVGLASARRSWGRWIPGRSDPVESAG